MKKFILLITVLFVSVISTACINNLAVQELNNIAKDYMANGEPEKAVCRLRSSIDLDTNIFETHYNLGVALIETKEYKEAQEALENAINLQPDFADSYYSLALALEQQAYELINKDEKTDENDDKNSLTTDKKELSAEEKTEIVKLFGKSIDNYNLYLAKLTDSKDKDKIKAQIDSINEEIKKYSLDNSDNSNNALQGED